MTVEEIKNAVRSGKTVHWKNDNYKVVMDRRAGFLIKSENNENYIGLTWKNGRTLNGEEKDFYIATRSSNYTEKQNKIRQILIKYGSPEHGDVVIDEICAVFGHLLTPEER